MFIELLVLTALYLFKKRKIVDNLFLLMDYPSTIHFTKQAPKEDAIILHYKLDEDFVLNMYSNALKKKFEVYVN